MKEAKQKFDSLVERIRSGDSVNFGEMEGVFAEAFLFHYLENSEKHEKRVREVMRRQAKEFRGDYEEDQEEDDEDIKEELVLRQEIEGIRTLASALGVRPKLSQLSKYTSTAIETSDWNLLKNVLGLSEEGRLGKGALEEIAVNELARGFEHSYKQLREQFPELELTSENLRGVYSQILLEHNPRRLDAVKQETGVPIPVDLCQLTYESDLRKGDPQSIRFSADVKQISGVQPRKTKEIKKAFASLPINQEKNRLLISEDELPLLDNLFGFYQDQELSQALQKRALEARDIDIFERAYRNSPHKLTEREIAKAYSSLDRENNSEGIAKLIEISHIAPRKPIFSRACSRLLTLLSLQHPGRDDLGVIVNLAQITGLTPKLSDEAIASYSGKESLEGNLTNIGRLSYLGARVPNRYVHQAASQHIARFGGEYLTFDELEERLNVFYKGFGLKPSPEVSGAKIIRLTSILEKDIDSSIREFSEFPDYDNKGLDPLTPVRMRNITQHNKFKSKIRGLLRGYQSKVKKIKRETAELTLPREIANKVYSICLELTLAQAAAEDDKFIRVEELSGILGIPVSRNQVRNALYNHTIRNFDYSIKHNPSGLIKKVNEAGIPIEVDSEMNNQVACEIVERGKNIGRAIAYLRKLSGINDLSQEVNKTARTRIVRDFSNVDLSEYDFLKDLTGDLRDLSDDEKTRISQGIVRRLKDYLCEYEARRIMEITGVQPTCDSWDLKEMVRKYFEGGVNRTEPSRIAGLVNQKLDLIQIHERELYLIHNGHIGEAKKLYQDTGFHPTEYGATSFIERYDKEHQAEIKGRLIAVFGQNAGVR